MEPGRQMTGPGYQTVLKDEWQGRLTAVSDGIWIWPGAATSRIEA